MGYSAHLDYINPMNLWKLTRDTLVPKKGTDIKATQTASCTPVHTMDLSRFAGSLFIRLAGFSGATAVAMGAYGSHAFYPRPDITSDLKDVYKTANYYHFLHTLALLAVPLTRKPVIVGSLFLAGMFIFSGTCYTYALTGNKSICRFTPYGGMILIIAWLSMML